MVMVRDGMKGTVKVGVGWIRWPADLFLGVLRRWDSEKDVYRSGGVIERHMDA